jgi:voltage-gated potassium channel
MLNHQSMLIPVLISLGVIFVTICIHGSATVWGVKLLLRKSATPNHQMKLNTALYLLSVSAIFLMILHFIEIAIWAVVFMIIPDIQELANFEEAIYFSMITYTTVGYGDITLGTHWRIMSGFMAMDGIMLFGWSSAMLYTVVQRILLKINPNSSIGQ